MAGIHALGFGLWVSVYGFRVSAVRGRSVVLGFGVWDRGIVLLE